jgi:hypothetical protein
MIKLERIKPGQVLTTKHINQCIDAIEELRRQPPGPGLAKAMDGTLYVVNKRRNVESVQSDSLSGDPKVLAHTQGTQDADTYSRDTDKVPVTFTFITDIGYDPVTHQLTYRERTATTDKLSSVSAESDLIVITEAQACPAS